MLLDRIAAIQYLLSMLLPLCMLVVLLVIMAWTIIRTYIAVRTDARDARALAERTARYSRFGHRH